MAKAFAQDRNGAQAELVARIAQLRRDRALLSVGELGRRSDALRRLAAQDGRDALAGLAGALSDALAASGRAAPVGAYLERMDDALAAAGQAGAGEALLAAVSSRFA